MTEMTRTPGRHDFSAQGRRRAQAGDPGTIEIRSSASTPSSVASTSAIGSSGSTLWHARPHGQQTACRGQIGELENFLLLRHCMASVRSP